MIEIYFIDLIDDELRGFAPIGMMGCWNNGRCSYIVDIMPSPCEPIARAQSIDDQSRPRPLPGFWVRTSYRLSD